MTLYSYLKPKTQGAVTSAQRLTYSDLLASMILSSSLRVELARHFHTALPGWPKVAFVNFNICFGFFEIPAIDESFVLRPGLAIPDLPQIIERIYPGPVAIGPKRLDGIRANVSEAHQLK